MAAGVKNDNAFGRRQDEPAILKDEFVPCGKRLVLPAKICEVMKDWSSDKNTTIVIMSDDGGVVCTPELAKVVKAELPNEVDFKVCPFTNDKWGEELTLEWGDMDCTCLPWLMKLALPTGTKTGTFVDLGVNNGLCSLPMLVGGHNVFGFDVSFNQNINNFVKLNGAAERFHATQTFLSNQPKNQRLDWMLRERAKIHVMKMDIDMSELPALAGARDLFLMRKVDILHLELVPEEINKTSFSGNDLAQLLEVVYGYSLFVIKWCWTCSKPLRHEPCVRQVKGKANRQLRCKPGYCADRKYSLEPMGLKHSQNKEYLNVSKASWWVAVSPKVVGKIPQPMQQCHCQNAIRCPHPCRGAPMQQCRMVAFDDEESDGHSH